MKKLLFMVLAVAVFAGCSKEEDKVLSEGDKITRSIGQIDTPLMEVLGGAISWIERAAYTYSEPNGEGEETELFVYEKNVAHRVNYPYRHPDFYPAEGLVINSNQIVKYICETYKIRERHYYDYDVIKQEDNTFIFTRNNEEYYLKVLAYNKDYIWVETDCYNVDKDYMRENGRANTYPYVRLLFVRTELIGMDVSMSEDEVKKDREENPDKYPYWKD